MELLFPLLIVALLVPMFLSMRRQRKELAKTANLQDSVKVGDRVVTSSGVYGTVVEVDTTTVDLEIAHDVVTTWLKLAIREVLADEDETEDIDSVSDSDTAEERPEDTERRLNQE
ncbi:preprotein translocase subunit YajC [Aldersonia sp. NBC_00410]|uniref:preprotein translocase subunit YajC n=1 Tax=Aldersonia sp. NBC_00410 TaxID=2975954 RepID=UPI002256F079|nr:preprotein translocase subunit YajC [Aldersonia sp. NBC_00410]MCX5045306.1 preprotein translocase subunit YajC [Aldersonia sp. NBC_00410]